MEDSSELLECIRSAYSGPGRISVPPYDQRNAITALGVHCLFIQAGFVPKEAEDAKLTTLHGFFSMFFGSSTKVSRGYRPMDDWLALLPSPEFVFRYTHPGKSGTFKCRCSVKPGTEQMLVHVMEENNRSNIQLVGLLVGHTVPESSKERLQQKDSWDGVFGDLGLLKFNVETYLIERLLQNAADDREHGRYGSEEGVLIWDLTGRSSWIKYGVVIVLLGIVTSTLLQRKRNT